MLRAKEVVLRLRHQCAAPALLAPAPGGTPHSAPHLPALLVTFEGIRVTSFSDGGGARAASGPMALRSPSALALAASLYLLLVAPCCSKKAGDPLKSPQARGGWWPTLSAKQARELKRADEQARGLPIVLLLREGSQCLVQSFKPDEAAAAWSYRYAALCALPPPPPALMRAPLPPPYLVCRAARTGSQHFHQT